MIFAIFINMDIVVIIFIASIYFVKGLWFPFIMEIVGNFEVISLFHNSFVIAFILTELRSS